jgi:hypothetical protein
MKEMVSADIFPHVVGKRSPLDYCAINNVIKCAGKEKNNNPTKIMKKLCDYYQTELQKLDPDVLVIMGNDADDYINKYILNKGYRKVYGNPEEDLLTYLLKNDDKKILYWQTAYPIGQGRRTFKGKKIANYNLLSKEIGFDRKFNQIEFNRYWVGKNNEKRSDLFYYTLRMVHEVKKKFKK